MNLTKYLNETHKTHLIFDFDETLFWLKLPWNKYNEEIKQIFLDFDPSWKELKESKIVFGDFQNMCVLKYGQKAKEIIINKNTQFERDDLTGVETNQNLVDFVKKNKNYHLFIWSSNTFPSIFKILEENSIINKFEKVITRNDVNLLKPNSEGFGKIYDPKIPKENYLFIGDSQTDIGACKNSGIEFFYEDYFNK